jgi:hypothetical protein
LQANTRSRPFRFAEQPAAQFLVKMRTGNACRFAMWQRGDRRRNRRRDAARCAARPALHHRMQIFAPPTGKQRGNIAGQSTSSAQVSLHKNSPAVRVSAQMPLLQLASVVHADPNPPKPRGPRSQNTIVSSLLWIWQDSLSGQS